LPFESEAVEAVITDPPYYDAVPYADLSDFFYVWLKRTVGDSYPDVFRTTVSPKRNELIEERPHSSLKHRKDRQHYEKGMATAFLEMRRTLDGDGVCCVMFAHKTTSAWESLIGGLLAARLCVSASWPIHTERPGRARSNDAAALASSVTLVCRKRSGGSPEGLWDDVRHELKSVSKERLDFFWKQSIRGADFFISAIGPALSVFGKYERVTRLSGEEVTVGQFLDEVRSLVSNYALAKILKTTQTGTIDPESRFYVVWKWSYGDAKVPADESFKLSQALGLETESIWDKTGVLEKAGENVLALPIGKRINIKHLGEPSPSGSPASLIDVLHRMCAFREKGDTQGMAQFLGRSGHANNHSLWLIAQAISEILPDGDKEKQLMQGLLNQREGLVEATRQGEFGFQRT
jgi:adenine-specific DNA methylase